MVREQQQQKQRKQQQQQHKTIRFCIFYDYVASLTASVAVVAAVVGHVLVSLSVSVFVFMFMLMFIFIYVSVCLYGCPCVRARTFVLSM